MCVIVWFVSWRVGGVLTKKGGEAPARATRNGVDSGPLGGRDGEGYRRPPVSKK